MIVGLKSHEPFTWLPVNQGQGDTDIIDIIMEFKYQVSSPAPRSLNLSSVVPTSPSNKLPPSLP